MQVGSFAHCDHTVILTFWTAQVNCHVDACESLQQYKVAELEMPSVPLKAALECAHKGTPEVIAPLAAAVSLIDCNAREAACLRHRVGLPSIVAA